MKIETLADMRAAFVKMAETNRLSITALNGISDVALGVLNRFIKGRDRRRINEVLVDETYEPDMKFSAVLKVVNAAGYEMIIQPKPTENRRKRVLAAIRQEVSE